GRVVPECRLVRGEGPEQVLDDRQSFRGIVRKGVLEDKYAILARTKPLFHPRSPHPARPVSLGRTIQHKTLEPVADASQRSNRVPLQSVGDRIAEELL